MFNAQELMAMTRKASPQPPHFNVIDTHQYMEDEIFFKDYNDAINCPLTFVQARLHQNYRRALITALFISPEIFNQPPATRRWRGDQWERREAAPLREGNK